MITVLTYFVDMTVVEDQPGAVTVDVDAVIKITNTGNNTHANTNSTTTTTATTTTVIVPSSPKVPDPELAELVPKCCDGAAGFIFMCGSCCTGTILVPLCVLLPIYLVATVPSQAVLGVLIALVVLGLLICTVSLRRTLTRGGCCMPKAAPLTSSVVNANNGERQHAKLSVRRAVIIVNPFGGLGRGCDIVASARAVWEEEFAMEVEVHETKYAGHTSDLAHSLDLQGVNCLAACGGDGTIHELVNGFFRRGKDECDRLFSGDFALGVIPGGSGNSVMHDLGVISPQEAARRIGRGDACWIDAVRCELDGGSGSIPPVLSVNLVALGLVGEVGVVAEKWRCLGAARYDACAVWGVLKKTTNAITVSTDDGFEFSDRAVTAFINLTQYFGEGLRAAPSARLDDGLMDLYVMERGSRDELFEIFQQLPKGAHEHHPRLTVRQCRSVTLQQGDRGVCNIDGEIYKYTGPINLTCLPKHYRIFAEPGALTMGSGTKGMNPANLV